MSQDSLVNDLARDLKSIAGKLNYSKADWRLVRLGNNFTFENTADRLVARISPASIAKPVIERQLSLARQLTKSAPILAPVSAEAVSLPSGQLVSFWPLAERDVKISTPELARLALACHGAPLNENLKRWSPDSRKEWRQASLKQALAAGLPSDLGEHLWQLYEESLRDAGKIFRAGGNSPFCLIHGDLYHGNVIRLDGRLLLCDLDDMAQGPKEQDLANILVEYRRYNDEAGGWQKFLASYPLSYRTDLLEALAGLQEVGVCLYLAGLWDIEPKVRTVLPKNIESLDRPDVKWAEF